MEDANGNGKGRWRRIGGGVGGESWGRVGEEEGKRKEEREEGKDGDDQDRSGEG